MNLIILGLIGALLIFLSIWMFKNNRSTPNGFAPIFTSGLALIAISIVQPQIVKMGDVEFQLAQIKKIIKPYFVYDIKNGKVVSDSFADEGIKIELIQYTPPKGDDEGIIVLRSNNRIEFTDIELDGDWSFSFIDRKSYESEDGWNYERKFVWLGYNSNEKQRPPEYFIFQGVPVQN